jgi:hypothetical protein
MKKILFLSILLGLQLAKAQTVEFTATLSGTNAVPPNNDPITGHGTFTLTGNTLAYHVVAVGFGLFNTGTIHGPAGPGTNAPAIFDLGPAQVAIPNPPNPGASLFTGSLTLTGQQTADLLAGLYYVVLANTDINGQLILDGQLRGQIAAADSDGDGVPDFVDRCPGTPAGTVVDADGCSIDQLCPCTGSWKNHGDYLTHVVRVVGRFYHEHLITGPEARALIKKAAASDCGKNPRHRE